MCKLILAFVRSIFISVRYKCKYLSVLYALHIYSYTYTTGHTYFPSFMSYAYSYTYTPGQTYLSVLYVFVPKTG
jgi:hypothetical protein